MGRVMTPVSQTVEDLEGDDWLGSSSHLGSSEPTQPTPPAQPFRQNLDPVAELQQEQDSFSQGEDVWSFMCCKLFNTYIHITKEQQLTK